MIAGGLRSWLLTRGESIIPGSSLTALVPMSVTEDDGEPTSLGSQVAPHLQRLPIGEPNPLMRLHQVAYDTQAHKDSGRAVAARSLADIAGFAPTTLHALGVRTSTEVVRKQHDLVITNVPGPQVALYAAGAQLVASYPVLPSRRATCLPLELPPTTARSSSVSPPTGTPSATSMCSPNACSMPSKSSWTQPSERRMRVSPRARRPQRPAAPLRRRQQRGRRQRVKRPD